MGYRKRKTKLDFYINVTATDTEEDIIKKIIYSLFVRPLKRKFPVTIFIGGGSGHGKSMAALKIMQLMLSIQGISLKDYIKECNVFTPFEYPTKLDALLNDKRLKKVNVMCVQEGRIVVKATNWQDFLNQAIGDVNALSRAVKRICFITISQFIKDIDKQIRYTLNYYCTAERPIKGRTKLYINKLWKDDRDLENPKLRKSKICGLLMYPDGRRVFVKPSYLEIKMPDKEIADIFDELDTASKSTILKGKMEEILKRMRKETGFTENNKVPALLDFYLKKPENLNLIGTRRAGKFKFNKEFLKMHDLSKQEIKEFETGIREKLTDEGAIV